MKKLKLLLFVISISLLSCNDKIINNYPLSGLIFKDANGNFYRVRENENENNTYYLDTIQKSDLDSLHIK